MSLFFFVQSEKRQRRVVEEHAKVVEKDAKVVEEHAKVVEKDAKVVEERAKTKIAEVSRQNAEHDAKAIPWISKSSVASADNFQQGAALYLAEALIQKDSPQLRAQWMEALQRSLVPIETSSRRLLIGSLVYSPDGNYLISGDVQGDGAIRVWNMHDRTQAHVLLGHPEPEDTQGFSTVRRLVFRPDRDHELVSAGLDGTIRCWDVVAGRELGRYPNDASSGSLQLLALDITPNPAPGGGCRIVTGDSKGTLVWWDLDGFRKVAEVVAHKPKVNAVRFHPGGHQCASTGPDGLVRLWDRNGGPKADLVVPDQKSGESPIALNDLAYSPDGKQLAAAGTDGLIYLWDIDSRKLVNKLRGHESGPDGRNWVFRLVYSPSRALVLRRD